MKKYFTPNMEVVTFTAKDMIHTSPSMPTYVTDPDELPTIPVGDDDDDEWED